MPKHNDKSRSVASRRFRCYVVGEGSLTIQCAEILLDEGHIILGIVSDVEQVLDWANQKGLAAIDSNGNYYEVLEKESFDYLFSIANLSILPEEILALPRKTAINFHDGPLPRYSGLNVTSWALLNQETTHTITWHFMEARVDAGDIIKQRTFAIADDETALTLNTKCFEAGIDSFRELVAELEVDSSERIKQDLDRRQYFGRNKRPQAACTIRWTQEAAQIDALVRALNFGRYTNPLGLPKLLIGHDAFLVQAIDVLPVRSGVTPGTVKAVDDNRVVIATATHDVVLTKILSLEGQLVAIGDLVESYGLVEGEVLPALSLEETTRLSDLNASICKNESFWVRCLSSLEPIQVPYVRLSRGDVSGQAYKTVAMPVPDGLNRMDVGTDCSTGEALAIAFCAYLSRLTGQAQFNVGFSTRELKEQIEGQEHFFATHVPWIVEVNGSKRAASVLEALVGQLRQVVARGTFIRDVYPRYPQLRPYVEQGGPPVFDVIVELTDEATSYTPQRGTVLAFVVAENGSTCEWVYDSAALRDEDVLKMQQQLNWFIEQVAQDGEAAFGKISLLVERAYQRLIYDWNDTERDFPRDVCTHQLFEQQVASTPTATALVSRGVALSYAALNDRANQLAHYLRKAGVGPEVRVGVCTDRSLDMVVSILAVLKAGGAYVPLDLDFPKDRIAFMVQDAQIPVLLTQQSLLAQLPEHQARVICVDTDWSNISKESRGNVDSGVRTDNLSYVIYTSGSTGRPKGVMVEHRNVVNFFAGMDERIDHDPPGVWLAVTSLSFDISVLELLWTLARGFQVVLYDGADERTTLPVNGQYRHAGVPLDFSLFFFASDEGGESAADKYRLLLEAAKFGDAHGFVAVWTPERHFHAFGGLYPNPSVTSAAIAAITQRIGLRAGSCVSPLHNPIRIAEEWSVVDNLSRGRVGISFASGWQPNDFVLRPETFQDRKQIMFQQIEEVRALWRGEAVTCKNGKGGDIEVRTLPRPVQRELPVWITAAGNPATFRMAGERGFNILTHLLGQSVEELAEKIAIFRGAWEEHGHGPGKGTVTLMLHTFVGEDDQAVRELVREPMKAYLRSSIGLIKAAAWSFPTFRQETTDEEGQFSIQHLSDEEMEEVLDFSFERYFETSGLFGTVDSCLKMVDRLKSIEVDEISCLIDYGVDADAMLAQLPLLNQVKEQANAAPEAAQNGRGVSIEKLIEQYQVTHLQCTPSMASMLVHAPETRQALGALQCMMVGGEALPVSLAHALYELIPGRVLNMFGPTETTIWSATWAVEPVADTVPIGTPIANTQIYIVDSSLQPVPIGVPGELCIGGKGVVRGYLDRDALTSERFVRSPFPSANGSRIYRTGDLARYRDDGVLEFLGRLDHQVKIRGYRIELGEIEVLLGACEGVQEAVAIVREDMPDDKRIVAYVIPEKDQKPQASNLKQQLSEKLPAYMVPAHIVFLDSFPLTPNKKVDRKALPAPSQSRPEGERSYVAPRDDLESKIAEIWEATLGMQPIGVDDNFFELGGHSLHVISILRRVEEAFGKRVAPTTLLQAPTVEEFARVFRGEGGNERKSVRGVGALFSSFVGRLKSLALSLPKT